MILFFIIFSFNFLITKSEEIDLSGSGSFEDNYYEIIENNNSTESILREKLFKNYNSITRPVIDYHDSIKVNFTLNINSLESFDQISEKVKFNMEMHYIWYDQYLSWDKNDFNIEYINLGSDNIWRPDLELYNSASYPELWSLEGSTKIYSVGKISWVLPILYEFSCPLELNDFPFDTQNCQMDFGSWKMNKDYLNIRINPDYKGNLTNYELVKYKDFRHNEWKIKKVEYLTDDIEYLCCPDEYWTITSINIHMTRNYHKYLVVMTMTAFLTISALVVNTLSVENYRRTYILVFIPLSIIWLQLYVASKIPVIEYSTLMEKFIISSYITCIICAIESGIIYCLLNNYFNFLRLIFKKKQKEVINYNVKKINFIAKKIDDGNNNTDLFLSLKRKILYFDDFFKLAIILGYFISIIIIV